MAHLADLIQVTKRKYPHLKRIEELMTGQTEDLQKEIFSRANAIEDDYVRIIDEAMDTNVGLFSRSDQRVRDRARLVVLLEAVQMGMKAPAASAGYSGLKELQKGIVRENDFTSAQDAVSRRLQSIKSAMETAAAAAAAAKQELQRKAAAKAEAAEAAETQMRVIFLREIKGIYDGKIAEMARGRQTMRWHYNDFATKYATKVLVRYTSAIIDIDTAVTQVEKILDTASESAERKAKFKREIAVGLFKAVRKYAPPPINLAGALVEAGVNLALGVLDHLQKAEITANIKMQVEGAALGKSALDAMQKMVTDRIKAGPIPSLSSIDGATTVAVMLDKAKVEAITVVEQAIAKILEEANLSMQGGSEEADFRPQMVHAASALDFGGVSSTIHQLLQHDRSTSAFDAAAPRLTRSPSIFNNRDLFRTKFNERLVETQTKQHLHFLQLKDQLNALTELQTPPAGSSPEFMRLAIIYVYALAMKGRVEAIGAGGKDSIPGLEDAEKTFLAKPEVNLITLDASKATSDALPIYYDGGNTTRYILVATLLDLVKSSENPFDALFSGEAGALSGVVTKLDGFYAANKKFGLDTRAAALNHSSIGLRRDAYKKDAYTNKLYR